MLAAVLIDGLDAVEAAVREALDAGAISRRRSSTSWRGGASRPRADHHLRGPGPRHPPIADCARYDQLEVPMQRHEMIEVFAMMGELKLYGMAGAFDETVTTGLKRKHEPEILADLLTAETARPPGRSIRYR